ncbi:MAG: serine hydrolase domain-containing protein [Bacteroidota bacterium]
MERKKVLFLFFLHLLVTNAQQQLSLPSKTELEKLLMENKVPALGVGTIENGEITNSFVLGHLKESVIAPNDAIFDTASITKSITTWLTLRLVDNELFNLDEPLYNHWVDPDVADDPFHKKLTARHILGHQSGFKNWRYMNEDNKLAFDFEPGTKVQYSGEGFEYLKEALTRKFNTSFSDLVHQWVFDPYEMNNAHVVWDSAIDLSKLAIAHSSDLQPYDFDIAQRKTASAADNFMTTVKDLCRFSQGILERKGISEALYSEMITARSPVKEGVAFGLGWIVFEGLENGEYALLNAGSDKGVNALLLLLPRSKTGLVLLTNGDNGRKLVMQVMGKTLSVGREILGRF